MSALVSRCRRSDMDATLLRVTLRNRKLAVVDQLHGMCLA